MRFLAPPDARKYRRTRRAVILMVLAVLIVDGAALAFHTRSTPLTVAQAVRNYRSRTTHRVPDTPTEDRGTAHGDQAAAPAGGLSSSSASTTSQPGARSLGVPTAGTPAARTPAAGVPGGSNAAKPSVSLPSPGVYIYATRGGERLSAPGSARQYPAQTTITLSPDGAACQTARWEPLHEHWEQYVLCSAGEAVNLESVSSYVNFYGVGEQTSMTCQQPAWWQPPTQAAGTSWSYVCSGSGGRYVSTGTVIGVGNVSVGNQSVPGVHLHVDTTFSGNEQGDSPEEMWLASSNGLVLQMSGTVDATQNAGPFGHVQYHEQFDLALTSTTPKQ